MNEVRALEGLSLAAEPMEFERFFRESYPQLARACYLLTGEAAEAEDLAQEAMARTFERWDRVSAMDSPEGYLFRTAFNLNRSRVRSLAVRARRVVGALPSPDPAEVAGSRYEVQAALRSLPVAQREALVLVGWYGMDAAEAGRVLGIDAASVRGRVHRARLSLRDKLGDEDDE
jgi:RNA polymerase sigma-70 factor, ECF subfamily